MADGLKERTGLETPAPPGLLAPQMRMGVLCDHALISQDGKLSLIGIFDRIAVPSLPIQHPRFFVVAVFEMAPGNHQVRVELIDPTGHNVLQEQVPIPVSVAGIGQSGNLAQACGHRDDPFVIEFEAVEHRSRQAHAPGNLHIEAVCVFDGFPAFFQRLSHGQQARIFFCRGKFGQGARCLFGVSSQVSHLFL